MDLQDFFDRWVPKLYGIHKYDRLAQWGRDFRTGDHVALTWRQACLREIQHWDISLDSARNWGTCWEKATDMARRYAYIMDAALQIQEQGQGQLRQEPQPKGVRLEREI